MGFTDIVKRPTNSSQETHHRGAPSRRRASGCEAEAWEAQLVASRVPPQPSSGSLDALAWEVAAMLDDIGAADQRQADATGQAIRLWRKHWPDDTLTSIPGLGPICSAAIRGWWGDATLVRRRQSGSGTHRSQPVDVVFGSHREPFPAHHQAGTRRTTPCPLPG